MKYVTASVSGKVYVLELRGGIYYEYAVLLDQEDANRTAAALNAAEGQDE